MTNIVPEGWLKIELGEIGKFSTSSIDKKIKENEPTVSLLNYMDVYKNSVLTDTYCFQQVTASIKHRTSSSVQHGDVFFTPSSETPDDLGHSAVFLGKIDNLVHSYHTIRFRPKTNEYLNNAFKAYAFKNTETYEYFRKRATGSTRFTLSLPIFNEIEVFLPPLQEQKKIAAILTSVDEVLKNTQKKIDKLQDLKKATMNELLTKGIGHTEFKDSELGRIPKSWNVHPLLKLSKGRFGIVDGPFGSNLKTEHYKSEGVPVIQSGFVTTGQFYAKKYVYVDCEKFNAEIRSAVASGDVVMAKIGAQAGRCAIMPKGHPTGILAGNSLKITTDEESLLATYLNHLLSHLYTTGEIQNLRTETAQPAISIATLKRYKIKVPTLLEQQKIIKVLSTIDIKLKSTREKSEKLQSLKKSLMQDLLTGKVRVTV